MALLVGSGSMATSLQNTLLLTAAAAALAPRGSLLSAVLLAAGSADWLHGAVLLAVPLGLLAASRHSTAGSGSGSAAAAQEGMALRRLAGYLCCWAATAATLACAHEALPPGLVAAVGFLGWRDAVPPASAASLAGDPLAWVGARAAQQPAHLSGAVVLPAASLEPGLGLHWYLLAQSFPQFRFAREAREGFGSPRCRRQAGRGAGLRQGCRLACGRHADPGVQWPALLACLPSYWLSAACCLVTAPPAAVAQRLRPALLAPRRVVAGRSSCTCCAGCQPPSCSRWRCGSAASRACCWPPARWRAACCTRGRS